MKRVDLIKHLQNHGCQIRRESRGHSIWFNPVTGRQAAYRDIEKWMTTRLGLYVDNSAFLRCSPQAPRKNSNTPTTSLWICNSLSFMNAVLPDPWMVNYEKSM